MNTSQDFVRNEDVLDDTDPLFNATTEYYEILNRHLLILKEESLVKYYAKLGVQHLQKAAVFGVVACGDSIVKSVTDTLLPSTAKTMASASNKVTTDAIINLASGKVGVTGFEAAKTHVVTPDVVDGISAVANEVVNATATASANGVDALFASIMDSPVTATVIPLMAVYAISKNKDNFLRMIGPLKHKIAKRLRKHAGFLQPEIDKILSDSGMRRVKLLAKELATVQSKDQRLKIINNTLKEGDHYSDVKPHLEILSSLSENAPELNKSILEYYHNKSDVNTNEVDGERLPTQLRDSAFYIAEAIAAISDSFNDELNSKPNAVTFNKKDRGKFPYSDRQMEISNHILKACSAAAAFDPEQCLLMHPEAGGLREFADLCGFIAQFKKDYQSDPDSLPLLSNEVKDEMLTLSELVCKASENKLNTLIAVKFEDLTLIKQQSIELENPPAPPTLEVETRTSRLSL